MTRRRPLAVAAALAGVVALGLASCGQPERAPRVEGPGPSGADASITACRHHPEPRVLFLALEADPDQLKAVRYFVSEWGRRLGCFEGIVTTDMGSLSRGGYDVAVVDLGYDVPFTAGEASAIRATLARRPVAVFATPGRVADHAPEAGAVASLGRVLPGLALQMPVGTDARVPCEGVTFSGPAWKSPFDLEKQTLFYEGPFLSVFDVRAKGPSEVLATAVNCTPGAPTVIDEGRAVVAGFSLGYELARADNNTPTVLVKEALVDVIHFLASESRP